MSTLREDFEAWARSQNWVCDRNSFGEYCHATARDGWDACQWATERAANIAQAMLDTEGDVGGDDWTPEMAWDWACQQIRNAIRGIDAPVQDLDGEAGEPR